MCMAYKKPRAKKLLVYSSKHQPTRKPCQPYLGIVVKAGKVCHILKI